MKKIQIKDKESWKEFILNEANYNVPEECQGGLCVDAGCNIGDFEMNHKDRFDKYICFDVFDENIEECKKNTSELNLNVEVYKNAVWSISGKKIPVMAYKPSDTDELNHFGNSGNIGCVEIKGEHEQGWFIENTIDLVESISIEDIIERHGVINVLKVDVEGSEYEFLLNKDLSKINYIVGEFHFSDLQKTELIEWIKKSHNQIDECVFVSKNIL